MEMLWIAVFMLLIFMFGQWVGYQMGKDYKSLSGLRNELNRLESRKKEIQRDIDNLISKDTP